MVFYYNNLTENDKLKDLYPKVNEIGNYLRNIKQNLDNDDNGNLTLFDYLDFNNILNSVQKSGIYYVTRTSNAPIGESNNGYVIFSNRDNKYYKIYYSPYNSNNLYIKTCNYNTVSSWAKVKLEETSQFDYGKTVDINVLNGTTTFYGTLLDPPKRGIDTGWVEYKEASGKRALMLDFKPNNSSSTFNKMYSNGSWSNWEEYRAVSEDKKSHIVDIESDNYFKYNFYSSSSGSKSLTDLIYDLPQGYHTVFVQRGIEGVPGSDSLRGTVFTTKSSGDISNQKRYIVANFNDLNGRSYSIGYNGASWSTLLQSEMSTTLWVGEFDYGSTDTLTLSDSIENYDILEVAYWTRSAGHQKTARFPLTTMSKPYYLYIRDFNLNNSDGVSNIDFYEGYCSFPTTTTVKGELSKNVSFDGSSNTSSVKAFNQEGYIKIYNIVGIKKL